MKIENHKRTEKEPFAFKSFADCPPDKLADYAEYMFNKIISGKATLEEFEMWIGWLEEDDTNYINDYIEKI